METQPSPSTKPRSVAGVTSRGLETVSLTVISAPPGPAIFTEPSEEPAGTLLQSTLTQSRCSFSMEPCGGFTEIHGGLGAAENSKGAAPLSKTSKAGSAGADLAPGQESTEPSTATPMAASSGSLISLTAGMVLRGGSCHMV